MISYRMKRFSGKKREKTPEPHQKPAPPDTFTNVAPESSGFRADRDDGVNGRHDGDCLDPGVGFHDPTAEIGSMNSASSRIAIRVGASESRVSSLEIDGTGSRHEFAILCQTDETGDTGVGESGPAGVSRTVKRAHKGTVLWNASSGSGKGAEERFGPLKAVLGAIPAACANDKGAVVVGNKIEDLLSRVVGLEEQFDSRPSDLAEQRRRDELRRDFERIEGQLRSLVEAQELQTGRASGLLEDLRETIFYYQTVQQEQVHKQRLREMDPAEATALNNFRSAQGAEHRHGNRIGCLKGTRSTVLDEIELWTKDFDKPPVYWLNGLAGTGKTTIAQTVAERTFADGKLGASFFCSRDFEDRNNLHFIFPTIAIQLARKYPDFRSLIVPLVQSDPGISHESLYNQLDTLIIKPLQESAVSTMVVIDALDECKDEEPASAILSVLGQLVSEIPKVKFLITGRPEPRIREGFRLPLLAKAADVFVLHDIESSQVDSDIRLFFGHKFSELARRRPGLDDWPSEGQLRVLCQRAAGLFVYAAATVKFVDKQSGNPRKQLDLLLQSPESSVREAKTKFKENTTLNSLYASILQGAFGDDDDSDNDPKVRSVLGAMILAANPLSPSTIAMLLGLDIEDVFPLLSSARSLLTLQEDVHYPVRPFHKSFPDFLTDPDRCTNKRFHVSPPIHHSQLLISSLDLMDRMLEKNMCKLPDFVANSDVSDLKERIERYIDPALQYACRSWHTHLVSGRSTSASTLEITSTIHKFLEKKLLFWLEVLSVLGAVRNAVDALQASVDWLEESPTLYLAKECSRFVIQYFETIDASSTHIYHSALVSTPRMSMVWELYRSYAQPSVRVVHGAPLSWDSTAAITKRPFAARSAAWSPSSRFIAIAGGNHLVIEVLDSVTLWRLQSLIVSRGWARVETPVALVFSPNGRMLSCASSDMENRFVSTWDLQTNGLVSCVELPFLDDERVYGGEFCITYSMDGRTVGILHCKSTTATISVVDVVSGVYTHDIYPGIPWMNGIWTHGESLRFATSEGAAITIWEVEFTQGATHKEIETLSVPNDAGQTRAFDLKMTKRVGQALWGSQNSVSLRRKTNSSLSFSSDGRFFARSGTRRGVKLFKESSTAYTLIGKLQSTAGHSIPLFSPNGKSIITFGGSTVIQLWHTKDFTTPSSISIDVPRCTKDFILEFVPHRQLAVVARREEKTVTVLDLKSGLPRLTIDAPTKVYGLMVAGNAVVVMSFEMFITWNLPEADSPPHARVGVENSTKITPFSERPSYLTQSLPTAIIPRDPKRPETEALRVDVWKDKIAESQSGPERSARYPLLRFRQESPCGYRAEEDGRWLINLDGKRLFMLPPPWQSSTGSRFVYEGQFFAFLHGALSKPVILELAQ